MAIDDIALMTPPGAAPTPAGAFRYSEGIEAEEKQLDFVRPVVAFEKSRRYVVRPLGPNYAPYASLTSLDQPDVAFVVTVPGLLYPDYVVQLPERDCEELQLRAPTEVMVLAIVRRKDVPVPVVNLMAPIVVNRHLAIASQVVLEGSTWGLTVPVDAPSAHWKGEGPCSS
jgi:flagellar assembly factor FliW